MFFYKLFQFIFYIPFMILFPTRVYGRKNLVKGGAVIIANHQTVLDVPLLGACIFKSQYFLAKKELFEKPILKTVLKMVRVVPINREKPELSSIKQCLSILKKDKYLTIFPQGTRKVGGKMEELKSGALMFSIKAKKPVTPVWIKKKAKVFRFNKVYIGKPIYPSEQNLTFEEQSNYLEGEILKFYKEHENNI